MKNNPFSVKLVSNIGMRFCFVFCLVIGGIQGASAPGAPQSIVRTDTRSGRLIRIVEGWDRKAAMKQVSRSSAKPEVRRIVEEKSLQHDLDPLLVDSVIQVESNYNSQAVSSKGALGLMQLIPVTARRFGVRDPFDPADNIEGGVKYLKHLHQLYKGDIRMALAAYNAGEGAVAKYGYIPPYAETQNYVREVSRRYGKARQQEASIKPVATAPKRIEQYTDAEGRIHFELR